MPNRTPPKIVTSETTPIAIFVISEDIVRSGDVAITQQEMCVYWLWDLGPIFDSVCGANLGKSQTAQVEFRRDSCDIATSQGSVKVITPDFDCLSRSGATDF